MTQKKTIAVHQLALPQGGGALTGIGETFQPNEFAGTSSLSIPIATSHSRDFKPSLSLDYSSGSGNGIFGLGFSLSIPNIARKTSKGIPRYDETDSFILSGAEDLVPIGKRTTQHNEIIISYRPRVDSLFARIEQHINQQTGTSHWQVVSTENVTNLYGRTQQAQIYSPQKTSQVFQWLLEESYDAHGSHIYYQYKSEDEKGISSEIYERNRSQTANKYIYRIKYGNATPTDQILSVPSAQQPDWHFEVVFDYGEYDLQPTNSNLYQAKANHTWLARKDPFSTYQAGFEIRTHRLCRNILMFHRFTAEFGSQPILVGATQLDYAETPSLTQLTSVTRTGYRYRSNQPYEKKQLPPLTFSYTPFKPDDLNHKFEPLQLETGHSLPGLNHAPDYQLIDLYGEGIPGILYGDGQTIRYWEPTNNQPNPQGPANYTQPVQPQTWPIGEHASTDHQHIQDINGSGRPDLIFTNPSYTGYFESQSDHTWSDFQTFQSFPTDYHQVRNHTVDATGNGLADLLLVDTEQVRIYPSLGKEGYGPPIIQAQQLDSPLPTAGSPTEAVRFIDIFGTGQHHLVRITRNSVECWPNLGYGRFGQKVTLANVPDMGADFDANRLFLADVDGSGTPDLVYLAADRPDQVQVWLNQSGNSFSQNPLQVNLPKAYNRFDQISFADVYGNGSDCLVFSDVEAQPQHWCYDFSRGQKPHLLNEIDNNMGAQTHITYASSIDYYLKDKQDKLPWITTVPFPVQVVAQVEHKDLIGQTNEVTTYEYHHGYYDGFEREFRGFGRVDRTDATSFADFNPADDSAQSAYRAPPQMTKTWYHTGAWLAEEALEAQYKKEYWAQDPIPYQSRPTSFQYKTKTPNADDQRESARALHGTVIRTEVYGRDGSPWQESPYTVTETQYEVKQWQQRGSHKYGIFTTHNQESITFDYERNPADPRIEHEFILELDDYDHIRQSCTIHYGRRTGQGTVVDSQTQAQQTELRAIYDQDEYLHLTDDFYLIGVPTSQKQVELKGLSVAQNEYFTLATLRAQIINTLQTPQSNRLLSWERDYYYNADTQTTLPFGQVTAQHLLYRTETACFDKAQLSSDFKGVLTTSELDQLLTTGDQHAIGGYITYQNGQAKGYYWNPGSLQTYGDAAQFYLPQEEYSPLQYGHLAGQVKTTYHYDPYFLTVIKVIDPLDNHVTAHIDYQTLKPYRLEDPNNNTSEAVFDPLGMVTATSFYGSEGSDTVGFDELSTLQSQPPANLADLLNHPARYLGNAAIHFYYDFSAWMQRQEPVHSVGLIAEVYKQGADLFPLPGTPAPVNVPVPPQIHLTYYDGFGRQLQVKAKVIETGEAYQKIGDTYHLQQNVAERWLTTGAVRYNDKGKPIQEFEPYFVDNPTYTPHSVGVSTMLFYDAMDQVVLEEMPKNETSTSQKLLTCLSKTLSGELVSGADPLPAKQLKGYLNQKLYGGLAQKFQPSAWSQLHFDENHTITESTYYRAVLADTPLVQPLPPHEKDALSQSAAFQNHPTQRCFDNLGQEIHTNQLNAAQKQIFLVDGSQTYRLLDILGDSLAESDARLHPQGKTNLTINYNLLKQTVKTVSADAGIHWVLHDVVGNLIYAKDTRGTVAKRAYDAVHRPTEVHVNNKTEGLNQVVERIVYGDSQVGGQSLIDPAAAQQWNLRGQRVIHFDQSGLNISAHYTIHGLPLAASKCLRQVEWTNNRLEEVDWDQIDTAKLKSLAKTLQPLTPATVTTLSLTATKPPRLEAEIYTIQTRYDALDRPTHTSDPDGNVTITQYDSRGLVKALTTIAGNKAPSSAATPAITDITYNAKGQQGNLTLGNGAQTHYSHDAYTFQLQAIKSTRSNQPDLQDVTYTYDPTGNITYVRDQVLPTVFYKGKVTPEASYTYDSLYRLTTATGREQAAMAANVQSNQNKRNAPLFKALDQQLTDPRAVRRYTQTFAYDIAGNLTRIQHSTGGTHQLQIQPESNRLQSSQVGKQSTTTYTYDANGNQQTLTGVRAVHWNYRNNIQSVTIIDRQGEPADVEGYVYDSQGQRTRKVRRVLAGNGSKFNTSEVIYLGNFEIRRSWQQSVQTSQTKATITKEWHWHRLHGICHWGYVIQGDTKAAKPTQLRYQLSNHLGSSTVELNHLAEIITYEEYYPYGGTAFVAAKGNSLDLARIEVTTKHYRYSGKELDEATGLYYYGVRYYASWLGRWMSADPAGTVDGLNLYAFVKGTPISAIDLKGLTGTKRKGTKRKRPSFNTNTKKASKIEHELETGQTPGNLKKANLAAPHRLPYAAIDSLVTAVENKHISVQQFGDKVVTPLVNASETTRKAIETGGLPTQTPKKKKQRVDLSDRYKTGEEKVHEAFNTYRKSPGAVNANELRKALNNLPSNAPSLGPQNPWNDSVNQALHLNVRDGTITPRSEAALEIALDPVLQGHMGVAGSVALTTKGDYIPTPEGQAVKLTGLRKAPQRRRMRRVPTVRRNRLTGTNHPLFTRRENIFK